MVHPYVMAAMRTGGLALFSASMIVLLVLYGKTMPLHPMLMVLCIGISGPIIFFPVAIIRNFRDLGALRRGLNRQFYHPKRSALIAFLFMAITTLVTFANPNVPGIMQSILVEGVVPFSILFSWMLLGRRFSWVHFVGAGLVLVGTFLPVVVQIKALSGYGSPLWCVVFFCGQAMTPLSSILQERFVKFAYRPNICDSEGTPPSTPSSIQVDSTVLIEKHRPDFALDIAWGIGWINLWQAVMTIVLCVIYYASGYGQMWELKVGVVCLFTGESPFPSDNCKYGLIFLLLNLTAVNMAGFMLPHVCRSDTAVFSTLITTIAPLLAVIIFSVPQIMGPYYEADLAGNWATWVGLAIVLIGAGVYKYASIRSGDQITTPARSCVLWMTNDVRGHEDLYVVGSESTSAPLLLHPVTADYGALSVKGGL
eukprot:TRINITY_DN14475_c0_g1_i1.p1 TRINITY_DN14475_c0_g1~~TRINITY_DN14475_c0_g1_i1.p1  ORF type:complete len:424 (-),score=73.14 TRINITY_DN14475_c0_g1_i1:307-1578(-)